MTEPELQDVARRLLGIGLSAELTMTPLAGGANNQVFAVASGEQRAVLKAYFQFPGDTRDRLASEYRFVEFAWSQGVRSIPRPLAADWEHRAALYEEVPGHRFSADRVSDEHVAQAADFFRDLNLHRGAPAARALPPASEAYFSIQHHFEGVGGRVSRLLTIDGSDPIVREAAAFASGELREAWADIVDKARRKCSQLGLSVDEALAPADRCLSPSDFGFHNAILESSGRVRFIDFEYAGWDDPAKLVCDFFCQEAVPVAERHLDGFAGRITSAVTNAQQARDRVHVLMPVYRLKWCCIMLNEFLPAGDARRRFRAQDGDHQARKARQLEKARNALHGLATT